jgi:putative chitinase
MGNGDEASGDGWKFRGRGYPQLTGKDNYVRAGKLVKKDLVKNPDLALDPLISAKVITYGMKTGMFTNKKLDDFFKPESADWFNARKIINGTDAAGPIGAYGQKFSSALWKAK